MSENTLLPDVPLPPRRYQVTVTLPRGDTGGALMPPEGQALAELAAAAVAAEGLLTAWLCTRTELVMVLERSCAADALAAGAKVAQALDGGDGPASVTADPVAGTVTSQA